MSTDWSAAGRKAWATRLARLGGAAPAPTPAPGPVDWIAAGFKASATRLQRALRRGDDPDIRRRLRRLQERADYHAAVLADREQQIGEAVTQAIAEGYAGDPSILRDAILATVQQLLDLDREFADSEQNPARLLREIARLGGISFRAESGGEHARRAGLDGLQGELRWLKEFQDTECFGQVAGVPGVFNEKHGRALDDLILSLQQGGEFQHITSPSDLVDAIADAVRQRRTDDDDDRALSLALSSLRPRWWERFDHVRHDNDITDDIPF